MDPEYVLVEQTQELARLAEQLSQETEIGVDLEADSMFHYQEKVCLLQISSPTRNVLIDPLASIDISSLAPVFANSGIKKIFHGADYDIRSLFRDFSITVDPLFDTQVAARFLGVRETGLASLVANRFGVEMEKKYQRKNWSQRPLPQEMLDYASKDTQHLISLAHMLQEELKEKGRLNWVLEECSLLAQVRPPQDNGNSFFLRFKGAGRLDSRSLAVLESVLQFRDSEAKNRDRPPFKILGHGTIMEVVTNKPVELDDLSRCRSVSKKQVNMFGDGLLNAVKNALAEPDANLPVYPRHPRVHTSPKVAQRVKALKQWREDLSGVLELDPAVVMTNAQIRSVAVAKPVKEEDFVGIEDLRTWQKMEFAEDILRVLKKIP